MIVRLSHKNLQPYISHFAMCYGLQKDFIHDSVSPMFSNKVLICNNVDNFVPNHQKEK